MKAVVVGLGAVGKALYDIASEKCEAYGYDLDPARTIHSLDEIPRAPDALHICFPYTEGFVDQVARYAELLAPGLIIIHSTVPVGTTEKVYEETGIDTVHSPVRGVHARMREHMLFWTKWIGPVNESSAVKARKHLEALGFKVRIARGPRETELAKLAETVYRALMIAWWQELHRTALREGASIVEVAEFVAEVHEVLGDRPIYYPGIIGGHCLIPNTELLYKAMPSKLLEAVLESNKARLEELSDPVVARDVEELKKLWSKMFPSWYASASGRALLRSPGRE